MEMLYQFLSWMFLGVGSTFIIIGAIGIIRLPDVFCRMHGAGIIDTLGAGLILGGLMIQAGFTLITIKLGFIYIFLLFTSPAATHALAQATMLAGVRPLTNIKNHEKSTSSKT